MATININIQLDTANGDTLETALGLLGFGEAVERDERPFEISAAKSNGAAPEVKPSSIATAGEIVALGPHDADGRKRGEPSKGRQRRTREQVEEDARYAEQQERAKSAIAAMDKGVEQPSIVMHTGPEISTGQPRVDPAEAAQDAADEAADSARHKSTEPTLDDLRAAIGDYTRKFGMAQAARRTPELLGQPLFEVPTRDIPAMVLKIRTAIEHDKPDPVGGAGGVMGSGSAVVNARTSILDETPTAPIATQEQYNAEVLRYMRTFDATDDQEKAVLTRTDLPIILERTFGSGKNSFRVIDKTPQNRALALAAIRAEIERNTFGRTPK